MDKVTLYKKDSKGAIRVWSIEIDYLDDLLIISHGTLGGELQEKEEYVEDGKAGRDIGEQLESRLESRLNRKIDQGYSRDINKAMEGTTNSLGLVMPMKAQTTVDKHLNFKPNILNFDWGCAYIQRKYNGLRCLATKQNGKLITYTRGSKELNAIRRIRSDLSNLPDGVTVDGEIYCHGVPLQTINSWAKREQTNTDKLVYVLYDLVSDDPFPIRLKKLKEIELCLGAHTVVAETLSVCNFDHANNLFQEFRDDGFEGAILRSGHGGYEPDKRPKSVLKMKGWLDDEFVVKRITESDKDSVAILHMQTKDGLWFKSTAPGPLSEKREVLRNKDEYIGLSVTIRYPELTKDGKPAQPVTVAWREKGE